MVCALMPSLAAISSMATSMLLCGDHGLDELLMAGHVNEDDLLVEARGVHEGEAKLDGDPSLLLLGEGDRLHRRDRP